MINNLFESLKEQPYEASHSEAYAIGYAEGYIEGIREVKISCAKEYVYKVMTGLSITFDEAVDYLGVKEDIAEIIKKDIMAQ